jgi:hypothetical protein
MPQYTGGKVSFSRTVQPVQYESKKAEVEISFIPDDGEDVEAALEEAGRLVVNRTLAMVGLKRVSE